MKRQTIRINSIAYQQEIDAILACKERHWFDVISYAICSIMATICLTAFIAPWLV